jgi:hypothetical protein
VNIVFDLDKITARQMGVFLKATQDSDLEAIADTLAVVVQECPAEWGDPSKPDTYLALPYFGGFQDTINALIEESKKYTS